MTPAPLPTAAPTGTGHAATPVETADLVATAVRGVPGVADLHPGPFGEAATYLPARRVVGVQLRPDGATVHVALLQGAPVLATADLVRAAAEQVLGVPVLVAVEDVLLAPGLAPAPVLAPAPAAAAAPAPAPAAGHAPSTGATDAGDPFVDRDGEPQ